MENLLSLAIRRAFDAHLHLRDGDLLDQVLPASLGWSWGGIVMPNLKPPVRTIADALAYRERILALVLPEEIKWQPLMSCYLTDNTDPEELRRAFSRDNPEERVFHAVKYYPAGATTNSEDGVTKIEKAFPKLEVMEEIGLPFSVHGEQLKYRRNGNEVSIFEREGVFIDETLEGVAKKFPRLRIVLEHVSTRDGIQFVQSELTHGRDIMATITPHHAIWSYNRLFDDGLRPDRYCMPILKRPSHVAEVRKAMVSGLPCFALGTDSAPHVHGKKWCACGAAGIFNSITALPAYVRVFEEEGVLGLPDGVKRLEDFCSVNGPYFYGFAPSEEHVTLVRKPWRVPEEFGQGENALSVFLGDETLNWRIA